MSNVILLIDGTEVYNNSRPSSTSTTSNAEYTVVQNPTKGKKYYYMEEKLDEDNNPVYTESKLEDIIYEDDGLYSTMNVYIFQDGHKAKNKIYKLNDSGGEIQKKKTTKFEKKKKIFQKEILNIINI